MKNIRREDIHIFSRHSNLTKKEVDQALKQKVYNDKASWQKFVGPLILSLGVIFTLKGIIFFFAYNWAEMHKFTKIGLVQGALILTTIAASILPINNNLRNIILMGASSLIGVFLAVFGQIYQTGADDYMLFLTWAIFIAPWVFISNYLPLSLMLLVLMNTALVLYFQDSPWSVICNLVFLLNSVVLTLSITIERGKVPPSIFTQIVAHIIIYVLTYGMIVSATFEGNFSPSFIGLTVLTIITFTLGIGYGLWTKKISYLSVISFSIILITVAFSMSFLSGGAGRGLFWYVVGLILSNSLPALLVSILTISSCVFTMKMLMNLQKKWTNEQQSEH